MWVTVLCPKCGVKNEIDMNELHDEVSCNCCFDKFPLPFHLQNRLDSRSDEEFALLGYGETSQPLDSSFWLS